MGQAGGGRGRRSIAGRARRAAGGIGSDEVRRPTAAAVATVPAITLLLLVAIPTARTDGHDPVPRTSSFAAAPADAGQLPSAATYGWGSDDWGQLGVGSTGSGTPTPVDQPATVDLPAGVQLQTVSAGGAHTLGLTTSGGIEAWGSDREGQLGDGSTTDEDAPVAVDASPGTTFTAVAAGSSHSLALTGGGQVEAWGANAFGQLGDGSTSGSDVPVSIEAPAGVTFTAVAAGGDHSLALSSSGQVWAWGANFAGQLGDGTTTASRVPVECPAPPGTDFVAVAAGTSFSMALTSTGSVYAWGDNGSGQLGDGTDQSSPTMAPVALPPGVTVSSIAAGGDHALALTSNGSVYEWGSDVFGQLATALVDSTPQDSWLPVQPLGLPPLTTFVAVAGGADASYALTSSGVVWTWGGNLYGQLGSGPPGLDAVVPAPLGSVPGGTLATTVDAGADATTAFLVTRADQQIAFPSLPTPTYGDPPVDVAPASSSGLGVTATGSGACTGPASHLALVGAGTCTVQAEQAGDFDYYPVAADLSFAVAPAIITVQPDDERGTVGSALPSLGYRLSGLVDRDPAWVVSGQPSCSTTATSDSPPGPYPITCSVGSLQAANYVFTVAGSATLELLSAPSGYVVVGADGSVWALGPARLGSAPSPPFYGSMSGRPLNGSVVGAAFTPLHDGYWLVATDGGIFAFGDARFDGSIGGHPLHRPVVGMAATPDGGGYWEVASDGGVFAFGDAGFYGSTGAITLHEPIVGMAPTPDGRGYWLVAADGGIFAFGDAPFYGSTGGEDIGQPVVGMAASPQGDGYWLTTASGAVFPFGRVPFEGSLRFVILGAPVVGMAPTDDGLGYWMLTADGGVYAFGDAAYYGRADASALQADGIA